MKAIRCFVSGRVQGVWFRGSTRCKAQSLGILGYAKNLVDGRVEVLAIGEPLVLNKLNDWLWHGPSSSRVDDVECKECSIDANTPILRFSIL